MEFFERLLQLLSEQYPQATRGADLRARLSPLLFCPEVIELPSALKTQAQAISSALFALREIPERQRQLEELEPRISDPGNFSALMSLDFHIDEKLNLRLIEVNTNASMGLMTDLLHRAHRIENPFGGDFAHEIINTFKAEWKAHGGRGEIQNAAICDAQPENQRLFVEFLMYKELFEKEGWKTAITDSSTFQHDPGRGLRLGENRIDLVYNRDTDFYFQTEATRALNASMLANDACISPHPHEYRLLADKSRLEELSRPGAIAALPLSSEHRQLIESTLIRTSTVADLNTEELWSKRKQYFFKPRRMFGGKAVYRGATISRTAFNENVLRGDYLAQELVVAPQVILRSSPEPYKYDLRFFVYRDRVQLACARLYRGQTTNSQTEGGGIAVIRWV